MKKLGVAFLLAFFCLPITALAATTWNPGDIGTNGTLSAGNLDFSQSGTSYVSVRATTGKSSGKWYWEVHWPSAGTHSVLVGAALAAAGLNTFVGNDASGWAYYVSGLKFTNGSSASYGASYSTTDYIGVALDMDNGTIAFYKNCASQGTAYTGITGTVYPAVSVENTSETLTGIFLDTSLHCSIPAGFSALDTGGGGGGGGTGGATSSVDQAEQNLGISVALFLASMVIMIWIFRKH